MECITMCRRELSPSVGFHVCHVYRHRVAPRHSLSKARLIALLAVVLMSLACNRQPRIRIVVQQSAPLLETATQELAARLRQTGYRVQISTGPKASASLTDAIILGVDASGMALKPGSFEIEPIRSSGYLLLRVTGADPRAALWGALEAADQLVLPAKDGLHGRLEAVRAIIASPFLPVRGASLVLPLPANASREERLQAGDQWRQYFDFLLRNRFNSVFFQASGPLTRFTNIAAPTEAASSPSVPAGEQAGNVEWLRELFKMARERGLDPYLVLKRAALATNSPSRAREQAELPRAMESSSGSPQPSGMAPPPVSAGALARALPAVLDTYPELAGVELAEDVIAMAGAPDRRAAWVLENLLLPLLQKKERRPVFLEVNGDWWPSKGAFGGIESSVPLYLCASLNKVEDDKLEKAASASAYRVLWQADAGPEELPWQDPSTVQEAIRRIGAANSLGFLEAPQQGGDQSGSANSVLPPGTGQDWFRMMLWGRLGYSPDLPGSYWVQQFESRFGTDGALVYAAASHASQILALLRSAGGGPPVAAGDLPVDQFLFQPVSGNAYGDFVTETLYQRGMMLVQKQDKNLGRSLVAEALQVEARETLEAARQASRNGAWAGEDNQDFYRRVTSLATAALSYADYISAAQALARFAVAGDEGSRQRAVQLLRQAQEGLATAASASSKEPRAEVALSSRIGRAIEFSSQLQPWRWDRVTWEVGTVDGWQPTPASKMPNVSEWRRAETSRLLEFGSYGTQPRMSSINQQLTAAFLPVNTDQKSAPGSLLVGKTVVAAKRDGRLVLSVVSSESPIVWVGGKRATRLSEQQFPWIPASPLQPPFRLQLFSAPLQVGNNEVVVAANAGENWPLISVNFLLAPEPKDVVSISARQAAQLEGLLFTAGSEISPQPYVSVADEETVFASTSPQAPSAPIAVYRFQVREAGFYRLRFWCNWRMAESANLSLALDGSALKKRLGPGDPVYQKWHWAPLDTVADLGVGEHTLAIQGWKRGAQLGTIEIAPAW